MKLVDDEQPHLAGAHQPDDEALFAVGAAMMPDRDLQGLQNGRVESRDRRLWRHLDAEDGDHLVIAVMGCVAERDSQGA